MCIVRMLEDTFSLGAANIKLPLTQQLKIYTMYMYPVIKIDGTSWNIFTTLNASM